MWPSNGDVTFCSLLGPRFIEPHLFSNPTHT
jgi:hypothetical protein